MQSIHECTVNRPDKLALDNTVITVNGKFTKKMDRWAELVNESDSNEEEEYELEFDASDVREVYDENTSYDHVHVRRW